MMHAGGAHGWCIMVLLSVVGAVMVAVLLRAVIRFFFLFLLCFEF